MAGLSGHESISMGLEQQLMGLEWKSKTNAVVGANAAAKAGRAAAEWTIDHTESSLSPGKMNRNWTFNMRNSLDSEVTQSGDTITVRVGWLENKEDYFLIQNDGGDVDGTTITPMNALMNGHTAILETLMSWGVKVS